MKIALASLLLASGLAHAESAKPFFYLLCDRSTGSTLDASTELSCDDSQCIDLSLRFEVKADDISIQAPMAQNLQDTCRLLRTESAGLLNQAAQSFVPYVERSGQEPLIGTLTAPGMGRLYPGDTFVMEFPAEGTYVLHVTRARASMRLEAAP